MPTPEAIELVERPFPSANTVVIHGDHALVVDTGFLSDVARTEAILAERSVLRSSTLLINTHWHSDHVGANAVLAQRYGLSVAAHEGEAAAIAAHDPHVYESTFLDQPVTPYAVDRALRDGERLDTGRCEVTVVHTPGHTHGHIALFEPGSRAVIGGDLAYLNDFGWINVIRDGFEAVDAAIASVDRLLALEPSRMFPGHGPLVERPLPVLHQARERYEQFKLDHAKLGGHACRRIFAFAVLVQQARSREDWHAYLVRAPWLVAFAERVFNREPAELADELIERLLRSGGLRLAADGTLESPLAEKSDAASRAPASF